MKSKFHLLRLLLVTAFIGAITSIAYAGPGLQYWKAMTEAAQFKKLNTGDKVAFVCYGCKTISEIPIQSAAQAESLGKEGSAVSCPACNQVAKVIVKSPRNDLSGPKIIVLVNEKGEECAFLATPVVSHEN
jgi:hypothetical protein